MDSGRDLRRMARGERCGECGSKKWYLQDGLRFCEQGHQVQGFVQYEVSDDLDAGRLGAVTRKEKEKRASEKRQLSGRQGKVLYLEALQLMLRNQVLWLVQHRQHGEELETVVRDLWDLRIRGSSTLLQDSQDGDQSQLEMFSSQTQPEEAPGDERSEPRAQSWNPERGARWPMPRLPETLALCYLGSLLLRAPLRQGELVSWVNEGSMPYKRAFKGLPSEMQDRMPSPYVKVFKSLNYSVFSGDELSKTVMDLVQSYHLNYKMIFPEICCASILVQYAKELALPIECIVVAKRLASSLRSDFEFHVDKHRTLPLDHPETRIITILVIATKLCFPFGGSPSSLKGSNTIDLPRFDWKCWEDGMNRESRGESDYEENAKITKTTPSELVHMSEKEFNAYCAQLLMLSGRKNDGPLTQYFSSGSLDESTLPEYREAEEEAHVRACRLLSRTLQPPPHPESAEPGSSACTVQPMYENFRCVSDLSKTAASFYQAAGKAAGVSLDALVRAVYMQEQQIIAWQEKRRSSSARQSDDP
ncbi:hypothetical protein HIM_02725 [Hirsutella minnesotensis 3608]|nr:hypothetical protein HIM_02725 [Hirsutella minnesotensis 3608]